MTNITVVYNDRDEFDMAHNAPEAWNVLAEVYATIRNQLKHGDPSEDRNTLEGVKSTLAEVRWKLT